MDDTRDKLNRRCPRLGSPVFFQYCRTCEDEKQPCWKIIDCWWETFDVNAYLRANVSEETLKRLSEAKSEPKVSHLVTLIEQAKQRLGQK